MLNQLYTNPNPDPNTDNTNLCSAHTMMPIQSLYPQFDSSLLLWTAKFRSSPKLKLRIYNFISLLRVNALSKQQLFFIKIFVRHINY